MEGQELQEYRQPLTAVEVRAQVNLIQEVMGAVMKKDLHYGTIPGTQKPTLFKPGSEKLLSTFRISIQPEVEDLSFGGDVIRYRVTCKAYDSKGAFLGAGIGECSTDEEKYKWRGVVCEAEWNATPEDQRRLKFYRNGNSVKQIRTNPADLANTVLKMAKKRAQIDVTLTVTAASDIFDQDIEDLSPEVREAIVGENGAGRKEPPTVTRKSQSGGQQEGNGKIQPAQLRAIYPMLKKLGVTEDQKHVFCAKALGIKGLKSLNDLTPEQGKELIQKLMSSEPAIEPEPTTGELMDMVTPDDIRDIFTGAGYAEDQILSKIGTILQEPPKKTIEEYSDQALKDVAAWMQENESA